MDYIHVILAVGRHQVILLSAHKLESFISSNLNIYNV